MKTEELLREYDRLFEAGDFDAAKALLDRLEPVGDDEWRRMLDEAPVDDEPLTVIESQRFGEFESFLARQAHRQAG